MRVLNLETAARPRLLYLCPEEPWRLDAGGPIRNYWLVRGLARRFDVDLVTSGRRDGPVPDDFAASCASIRRFAPPSRARRLAGALTPGRTLYTTGNVSPELREETARLLREHRYDAIALDLSMIDALPPGCAVPIIYNAHNCETALLRRRAQSERTLLRRVVTGVDAVRLQPIESRLLARAAFVAACSKSDIDDLASLAPGIRRKAVVVANGVDCERYRVVAESIPEPDVVLVTGSFDWEPNRIGLRWFVRDVIPALHRMTPRAPIQVRIAGRMDAVLAAQLDAIPGVQAFPNVPDMRDQLARATVVAAPVLVSSGTRLRILEGWAAGRPVVTTPEGAFGLEYLDDDDIVVRRGAENFARAIVELLADPERRSALRRAGLRRAAIYDWRRVADTLLDAAGRLGCESTPSD